MARALGRQTVEWKRPRYVFGLEENTATIVGTGPYSRCLSERPKVGTNHAKVKGNFLITKVIVESGRSNDGQITVELSSNTSEGENTEEPKPIYELDWGNETKPIEQNPKRPKLKKTRPWYPYPNKPFNADYNPRVDENDAATFNDEKWATAPWGQRTYAHLNVLDSEDVDGGEWSPDDLRTVKQEADEYTFTFPIATATTYSVDRPTGVGAGLLQVSNPPGEIGAPDGWFYVKTIDRIRKEGDRWTRIEAWEGRRGEEGASAELIYS